jgi:prolyl oligopeptidase
MKFRLDDGVWRGEPIRTPGVGSVNNVRASAGSERFFFTYSGFDQPTTLYAVDAGGSTTVVQQAPGFFETEGLTVHQYEAVSADGTAVPYFLVLPAGAVMDGSTPTLLYGYGGFQVSLTPGYNALVGALWLEQGGAYVVANIRGGGEFGPSWHRSAQRENKQRSYDDFIAVAEDLVAQGVTTTDRLGIYGGSNGGLLVGAALTQRPDLFGAAVSAVPLLDMQRYHVLLAGASWMAEFGNPDDPADWEFIRQFSPYHNLDPEADYPPVLFTTTTRDDRVHPGHARKMAARMEAQGHPVYYFENTEGGHGAGTTPEQRALTVAVTFAYLFEHLR